MLPLVVPSHAVAVWMMENIDRLLDWIGLEKDPHTEEFFYVVIVVGLSFFIGWTVRVGILFLARKVVSMSHSRFGQDLLDNHILSTCSHVIPPLVILGLTPYAFESTSFLMRLFEKSLIIYTIIVFVNAINAILTFIYIRYDQNKNNKNLPLKGILNSAKGVVWIIAAVIGVSILVDKSPAALLTGMTAFAAVLMLVFKDSLLGFVSGIQLSQNDMIHVGDWIVVPSTPANGIVQDVSLTTVKVQNWDNTIVTLPPYMLVQGSFQNWRGMTESGARQIARSITFVMTSIHPIDAKFIDDVCKKFPSIAPFVAKIRQGGGKPVFDPDNNTVNGTIDTNLGLFRAYMCRYLLDNPSITKNIQILVRTLAPTSTGIPVQLWCYTSTPNFVAYEAIQSAVFEHIAAVAPLFDLKVFNYSSDNDLTDVVMMPTQPAS